MQRRRTDLARDTSKGAVYVEKDFSDDVQKFRNIVPLAAVVLKEALVEFVEGRRAEGCASAIRSQS